MSYRRHHRRFSALYFKLGGVKAAAPLFAFCFSLLALFAFGSCASAKPDIKDVRSDPKFKMREGRFFKENLSNGIPVVIKEGIGDRAGFAFALLIEGGTSLQSHSTAGTDRIVFSLVLSNAEDLIKSAEGEALKTDIMRPFMECTPDYSLFGFSSEKKYFETAKSAFLTSFSDTSFTEEKLSDFKREYKKTNARRFLPERFMQAVRKEIFAGTPYELSPDPTCDSLKNIKLNDVNARYSAMKDPARLKIIATGNFDEKQAALLTSELEKSLGNLRHLESAAEKFGGAPFSEVYDRKNPRSESSSLPDASASLKPQDRETPHSKTSPLPAALTSLNIAAGAKIFDRAGFLEETNTELDAFLPDDPPSDKNAGTDPALHSDRDIAGVMSLGGDEKLLAGVFAAPVFSSEDYPAFALCVMVFNNMLRRSLLGVGNAARSAGCALLPGKTQAGIISVYGAKDAETVMETVNSLKTSFPSAADLERILFQYKRDFVFQSVRAGESSERELFCLVRSWEYLSLPEAYTRRPSVINEVSAAQVFAAFETYIEKAPIEWFVLK
ncbi:insulinase family protein [Treponema parvum]|uniref:Insulinase family protein n=1 Tax=Treponema parvum TaxID=138851 RepID=A0A975F0A6_9SPIR|nr:insulinase family protein [Treponema parvum]QTQ12230.1 insulinase family protein [Treponema parvum]